MIPLKSRGSAKGVLKCLASEHLKEVLLQTCQAVWMGHEYPISIGVEWDDCGVKKSWRKVVGSSQELVDAIAALSVVEMNGVGAKLQLHGPLVTASNHVEAELQLARDSSDITVLPNGSTSFDLAVTLWSFNVAPRADLRNIEQAVGRLFDEKFFDEPRSWQSNFRSDPAVIFEAAQGARDSEQAELERAKIRKRDRWIRDIVIFAAIVIIVIYSIYSTR